MSSCSWRSVIMSKATKIVRALGVKLSEVLAAVEE
jgi:hypothetical protein